MMFFAILYYLIPHFMKVERTVVNGLNKSVIVDGPR